MEAGMIKCQSCGKWKQRGHFSQRQLAKYDKNAATNHASPAKSGIQCKEHASNTLEMKCNGPCNRVRELRFFSKSTRRSGKNWCVDCTSWQVMQEPGDTLPPPGSQLSPEEQEFGLARDPTRFANLSLTDRVAEDFAVIQSGSVDYGGASDVTSTLAQSDLQSESSDSPSQSNSVNDAPAESALDRITPTHLRGPGPGRAPHWFLPPMDNDFQTKLFGKSTVHDTESGIGENDAFPRRPAAPKQPISFNAWGPDGEHVRMTKTPTIASGNTYAGQSSRETVELGRKGWAKPSQRKRPPQIPDYLKGGRPIVAGDEDDDGLDLGSDDGITWHRPSDQQ
ncbi:hypothetical protein N656DRAFT_842617 [Canariomyces notabilis]|uniref:Stc1 domain-containing protein n=1 Tax=Canariomyces notabilis TaxID=2074819 RepID=A0AAN6YVQ2_9PEZI|nr:hypothetical protein N656DRAFT_842617 [Canariomyces arenarius]